MAGARGFMSKSLLDKIRRRRKFGDHTIEEYKEVADRAAQVLQFLTEMLVRINDILIEEDLMHLFEDDERVMTTFAVAQEEWREME